MRNKQPNGQTFGPKMAKALLIRVNTLEDAVISQQKRIMELESEIANNNMGHVLMKKRYEDMMHYVELNKPEILKLMKLHAKHGVLAAQGKLPSVHVTLVKKRKKVRVVPSELPLSAKDAEEFAGDVALQEEHSVIDEFETFQTGGHT